MSCVFISEIKWFLSISTPPTHCDSLYLAASASLRSPGSLLLVTHNLAPFRSVCPPFGRVRRHRQAPNQLKSPRNRATADPLLHFSHLYKSFLIWSCFMCIVVVIYCIYICVQGDERAHSFIYPCRHLSPFPLSIISQTPLHIHNHQLPAKFKVHTNLQLHTSPLL